MAEDEVEALKSLLIQHGIPLPTSTPPILGSQPSVAKEDTVGPEHLRIDTVKDIAKEFTESSVPETEVFYLALCLPFEEENTHLMTEMYPNVTHQPPVGHNMFQDVMLGIRGRKAAGKANEGAKDADDVYSGENVASAMLQKRDESVSIIRSTACMSINAQFWNWQRRSRGHGGEEETPEMRRKRIWRRLFFRFKIYVRFIRLWLQPYTKRCFTSNHQLKGEKGVSLLLAAARLRADEMQGQHSFRTNFKITMHGSNENKGKLYVPVRKAQGRRMIEELASRATMNPLLGSKAATPTDTHRATKPFWAWEHVNVPSQKGPVLMIGKYEMAGFTGGADKGDDEKSKEGDNTTIAIARENIVRTIEPPSFSRDDGNAASKNRAQKCGITTYVIKVLDAIGLINQHEAIETKLSAKIVLDHKFTTFVILLVTFLSLFLAVTEGSVFDAKAHSWWMEPLNWVCSLVFTLEVAIRSSVMGIRKYFTSCICIMDFVVTVLDWISVALQSVLREDSSKTAIDALVALRFVRLIRLWRLGRVAQHSRKRKFTTTQKHLPYLTSDALFAATALREEYEQYFPREVHVVAQQPARGEHACHPAYRHTYQHNDHMAWNLILANTIKIRLEKTCGFKVYGKILRLKDNFPQMICLYIGGSNDTYVHLAGLTGHRLQLNNRPDITAFPKHQGNTKSEARKELDAHCCKLLNERLERFQLHARGNQFLDYHLFEACTHRSLLVALNRWGHQQGQFHDDDVAEEDTYYAPYVPYTTDKAMQRVFRTYPGHRQRREVDGALNILTDGDKIKLTLKQIDRHLNLPHLLSVVCADYFIPHDDARKQNLHDTWAKNQFFNFEDMPAKKLESYFGSDVAFYFIWLGTYVKTMRFTAIVGIGVFVAQTAIFFNPAYTKHRATAAALFCGPSASSLALGTNSTVAQTDTTSVNANTTTLLTLGGLQNSSFGSAYAVLNISYVLVATYWAVSYRKTWNGMQARTELLFEGGQGEEGTRDATGNPKFKGILRRNPVTDVVEKYYTDKTTSKFDRVFSSSILGLLMMVVLVACVGIIAFRVFLRMVVPDYTWLAGILNGVVIVMLDVVWKKVAVHMTAFENHLTVEQYQSALINKIFVFSFVNSYITIFYVTFWKAMWPCDCVPQNDCASEAQIQLYTIVFTRLTFQNALEVYSENVQRLQKKVMQKIFKLKDLIAPQAQSRGAHLHYVPKDDDGDRMIDKSPLAEKTRKELDCPLYGFNDQFNNFNEIVINHGYWLLFAGVFPIGAALTLFLNTLECRLDAVSMCQEEAGGYRRPNPMVENEINQWKRLVDHLSTFSYVTNAGLVVLTSNVFQGTPAMEKLVYSGALACMVGWMHYLSVSMRSKDEKLATTLGNRFKRLALIIQGISLGNHATRSPALGEKQVALEEETERDMRAQKKKQ